LLSSTTFLPHLTSLFPFTHPAPTHIYTLSLHDALPISRLRDGNHLHLRPPSRRAAQGHQSRAPQPDVLRLSACDDGLGREHGRPDRKSTRLNSSHVSISYAVFCLKKKKKIKYTNNKNTT